MKGIARGRVGLLIGRVTWARGRILARVWRGRGRSRARGGEPDTQRRLFARKEITRWGPAVRGEKEDKEREEKKERERESYVWERELREISLMSMRGERRWLAACAGDWAFLFLN